MLLFYPVLAFILFFLQNLLPLPHHLRLDLLTVFVVFACLRAGFLVALVLALILGFTLDCYGTAPLGLQAGLLLTAVVGTEILRRHLNFLYIVPQIIGVAAVMLLQGAVMLALLHLLVPVPVVNPAMVRQVLLQLGVTALSAPLVLAIFRLLERFWRRWRFI